MFAVDNIVLPTAAAEDERVRLVVENGRIVSLEPAGAPLPIPTIDGRGLLIAPGFIDLQLNGGFGHDFTTNPDAIWRVAAQLPQFGVTAFLPTIITSPSETVARAQGVLAAPPPDFIGASPLGLHVEGPFLNPQKKGAHQARYLRMPDKTAVKSWSPANGIRLVTLAPELPNALPLIQQLTEQGVVVSAGHSMATLDQAVAGFDAGIRYGTHLFNAMPPLHHREPGLVGALLNDNRAMIGLIPDGVHLHPALVNLVWQVVGNERLTLVTDSMAAMGMPAGRYKLAGQSVQVDDKKATLADGTLAGAIVTMDAALRKFMQFTDTSLVNALPPITETPAKLLGDAARGHLAKGMAADFVLLTRHGEVEATFVAGQVAYARRQRVPELEDEQYAN